jgi:hypothetical protein
MRIARIWAYRVLLPLVEGRYSWSLGKSVDVFDSTLVRVATDDGLEGGARPARSGQSTCPPTPRA